MTDFSRENLSGSRFEELRLVGASFRDVDLSNARFHTVDMRGVTIRGAALRDVEISGEIESLRVNGVDVVPYVEAELNRRYPDRAKMRPDDAAGFRAAWDILERLWQQTVERARAMAPELLHERVDGEWSFIETLRHLVFATDVWVNRVLLRDPSPWDPLGLPFDEMDPDPSIPWDRDARPALDEVLALRADRMSTVRRVIGALTDDKLVDVVDPRLAPPWRDEERTITVRECLEVVLNEEWEHRLYAERDLDVLDSRSS